MGHVKSKTRSQVQILEKPCVCSRGHIFSPIIMKLGQNVFLDKILDEYENGSCMIQKSVTRSNLRKPYVRSKGHIFSPIIMKLGQNVCLDKISDEYENGSCRIKK